MGAPRIFVSAGEASGDLHGANLVRALRRLAPDAEIAGLGGPRMREAGVRLLADTSWFGIIGVAPILATFGDYLGLLSGADRFLGAWRPDVAVTIDCPGFHFLLGSRARARRVPLLWYIPPQLWAWAPWRVRKLKRRFTRVACVLPHEEAFFRQAGVPVTFVGNPVVDHLRQAQLDTAVSASLRVGAGQRLVALLPGSRRQEVPRILTRQLALARSLEARCGPCRFVLALAEERHRAWAAPALRGSGVPVRTFVGHTHEVQRAADLALVASGTATLELTCTETPMIVFYKVTWAQWHLVGRWLLTTRYLSLPNVLAGREIVPEFIRDVPPTPAMVDAAACLLTDDERRRETKAALAEVHGRLQRPGAAENTAREVLDMVGTRVAKPPALRPGFAM